ncbi:MAG: Cdc6/Cdc18 family protein [Candidatus Woesearchaeota archaeon]
MSLFKDMLKDDETLFSNELALDYDFVPKLLPHREEKQKYIAACIAPLIQSRNGKNLFIYGDPGIGKTAATRWVLRDLEDETEDVFPIYINCWQKNTSYKVIVEICDQLGYRFTQNKKTDELFRVAKGIINNKKSAVFAFDEVDKLEDDDFLYMISEEIFKKSLLLITNYKEWIIHLDGRVKSRLTPDTLEFEKYSAREITDILKERVKYAFYQDVWEDEAFDLIVEKAFELGDVRQGIYLLRESGRCAEEVSSRRITSEHATQAIKKLEEFSIKKSTDLEEDSQLILNIIKENTGKRIGDLYRIYKEQGGDKTSKTFQRKIEKLEKARFIETTKTGGGTAGNTTYVHRKKNKNLNDF